MDRSLLLPGTAPGLGRKIAETILSNFVQSRHTRVQAHASQFAFIQKLRRFSGVAFADLRVYKRALLLVGIVLLALARPPSVAAQTLDLTQKSLEDLMSIKVTSVSKKEQKTSQAPAAIFVISREDIARSGALNIPDLLRMVPGLDVAQIDASNWAISARGFNGQFSDKLLVLVDGRTVYTNTFDGVFWDSQNVPLGSIERIEVIRGPGAAIWGSNAVNGVINIITLSAADTQGATVAASTGNGSIGPETLSYGGKIRNFGAYRVYGEGFEVNALPTLAGLAGQDDWRLVHGGFRTDSPLSAKDSLTTEGEVYVGNAGELAYIPLSLQPPESATVALRNDYSGWNVLTRWNRAFSARSQTSLQVYFDRTSRGDTTYSIGINAFDIDFQHHFGWGTRQDIVWGLGYRLSEDDINPTFRISANHPVRNTQLFRLFGQDEIAILADHIHLSLGARVERNDYTGFDFEPSGRLMWTPGARNSIWAAVSHADRTPDRSDTDLRVNFEALPGPDEVPILVSIFGNPAQRNEELTAYEAGYRAALTNRISWDSTAYYNRYGDLVSLQPQATRTETNPAPTHVLISSLFGNGLYGEASGIETFAIWKVTRLWTLDPGYAFGALRLHQIAASHDPESIPETEGASPDHQAQVRSHLELPWKLQWNASVYFVDRLPAQSIPSYTRLDTGLIWRAGERVSFSLAGQNLLKDLHPEFSGTDSTVQSNLMRRAGYGKIIWSF